MNVDIDPEALANNRIDHGDQEDNEEENSQNDEAAQNLMQAGEDY